MTIERPAAQLGERHVVALAVELQVDAVVDDALAVHALADARVAQELDRALLEHARADAVLDVFAAAVLEDDALDPRDLEQPREREPGRAGADDPDLRPHSPSLRRARAGRPRTRCSRRARRSTRRECRSTSEISSSERPFRRAARMCSASSSKRPSATSAVSVMQLRVRRSRPGRAQISPHA